MGASTSTNPFRRRLSSRPKSTLNGSKRKSSPSCKPSKTRENKKKEANKILTSKTTLELPETLTTTNFWDSDQSPPKSQEMKNQEETETSTETIEGIKAKRTKNPSSTTKTSLPFDHRYPEP